MLDRLRMSEVNARLVRAGGGLQTMPTQEAVLGSWVAF